MFTANLAPAVDGIRLTLHVLAAAVWVGGQITLAGLVPTARTLGEDAAKKLAQAFARVSWPAFLVLVATGIWNVSAVGKHQPHAWKVVLGIKIGVVLLSAVGAQLHSTSQSKAGLAIWGAVGSLSALAALTMGVFLAG